MSFKQKLIWCGRSSVVEYRLPKPWVASSNLVARSSKFRPSGDYVRKALPFIWDFQWKSRFGMATNMET